MFTHQCYLVARILDTAISCSLTISVNIGREIEMKKLGFALALFAGLALSTSQALAEDSPLTVEGARTVNATEAKALFDKGVTFVDLRTDAAFDAGRIPGAVHLEFKTNFTDETLGKEAKKDQEVVLYCSGPTCMRAPEGSKKAVSWGFTKVFYYRGGFPSWQKAGYPVE